MMGLLSFPLYYPISFGRVPWGQCGSMLGEGNEEPSDRPVATRRGLIDIYFPEVLLMTYTCQNCGVEAEDASSLCKPVQEELTGKFCGISAAQICSDKLGAMKFSCDSCGRVSPDAEHLCNPSQIA